MGNEVQSPSRYGSQGEHVDWRAAIKLYERDQVVEARDLALKLGVGATAAMTSWYRLFEAEAETRERARVVPLFDWLDLEFVPEHAPPVENFEPYIRSAVNQIADRIGQPHAPKTRIAILNPDADAPWAIGRYGYMTAKDPYAKICLPHRIFGSAALLNVTLQHEYAHVLVNSAAEGKAPQWLDEGIAMLAEPHLSLDVKRGFASGELEWLSPTALDAAFHAERRNGENSGRIHLAYEQAAWIVRHLTSICGEQHIGNLLTGFVNNSAWTEIRMRVTGQHAADEALREVFGVGEEELFSAARLALR